MGMANGYTSLASYIDSHRGNTASIHHAATLGRIAHIILAVRYKLIHGDAHMGNVMISETESDWLSPGFPGRALLIDFGRTVAINAAEYAANVSAIVNDATRPRSWHRLLPFIRGAAYQNAQWLDGTLFPGENIILDVDRGSEELNTSWLSRKHALATIPNIAALGPDPTSSQVERVIKRSKGLRSLFDVVPLHGGRGRTRRAKKAVRTRKNL
jgi:hypothetical protein